MVREEEFGKVVEFLNTIFKAIVMTDIEAGEDDENYCDEEEGRQNERVRRE